MALETLREVTKIRNVEIKRVEWEQPKDHFIEVNDAHNAITFKIQNGPALRKGVNGCQVDALIETAKLMLEGLNRKVPARETAIVITKLEEALMWLDKRTADRTNRGVEGTDNA